MVVKHQAVVSGTSYTVTFTDTVHSFLVKNMSDGEVDVALGCAVGTDNYVTIPKDSWERLSNNELIPADTLGCTVVGITARGSGTVEVRALC